MAATPHAPYSHPQALTIDPGIHQSPTSALSQRIHTTSPQLRPIKSHRSLSSSSQATGNLHHSSQSKKTPSTVTLSAPDTSPSNSPGESTRAFADKHDAQIMKILANVRSDVHQFPVI